MKQTGLAVFIIVFSLLGIVMMNSAYVVDQTEQAVITQFGEPMSGPVVEPGLHWKTPFIQIVHTFDKRILNWDGYPSEVTTLDKKLIWVDVAGRWRIEDPLRFLQAIQNERNAQSRLDAIMDGETRNVISRYNLVEVVRSTNTILEKKDKDQLDIDVVFDKIEVGRNTITREILNAARPTAKELGIELIDIRIKRINYIRDVLVTVYERMIAERKRAAEQLRSEGQGVRAEIEGQRQRDLKKITSEAYMKVQAVKGKADAEATRIYGEAYSKDPDFYAFVTTLEKYPQALQNSRAVLTTDNEFLKYLKRSE